MQIKILAVSSFKMNILRLDTQKHQQGQDVFSWLSLNCVLALELLLFSFYFLSMLLLLVVWPAGSPCHQDLPSNGHEFYEGWVF